MKKLTLVIKGFDAHESDEIVFCVKHKIIFILAFCFNPLPPSPKNNQKRKGVEIFFVVLCKKLFPQTLK